MTRSKLRRAWQRCLSLFTKGRLDSEFDDEAQSHIALATDDYVARGMPLHEAQRLARLRFGMAASKDAHRDARGLAWLDSLLFDLRLAVRALGRDRLYSVAAVGMLAMALALNVTVYTVMDAMLYRGFPLVERNDRIAYIQERTTTAWGMSYANLEVWRTEARSFQALAFLGSRLIALRDGDGRQADLTAGIVSANMFRLLGVAPLLGRDFADEDEVEGAPQTAILSHRFWTQRYDANPSVVGSTVQIDGVPTMIIAVMPERFEFTNKNTGMWMPVVRTRALLERGPTQGSYVAVGRLRDGVSLDAARAELESINARLALAYPDTNRGLVPTLFTRAQFISGSEATMVWGSLWAGSWFVVLIACANLANLTLVRSIGRWREFVTTLALGAGQARVMRQIAIEGVLLTGTAAAIAWIVTRWAVHAWSTATASSYQILDYTVDIRTLTYLLAVAAASALLFSMAPMLRIRQVGVGGALRSDARGVTQSPWSRHMSAGLVAVQMTLAIVLLSGAGVLVRSLTNITGADTRVREPESVLVGLLRLPSLKYPDTPQRFAVLERVESALRAIPGLELEAISGGLPVIRSGPQRPFEIQGRPAHPDEPLMATTVTAGPEYFRVLGALPVSGRAFTAADHASSAPVAIVNQRLADELWPGESAVGRHLQFLDRGGAGEWRTIVGVVPNIMEGDALRQRFNPVVYTPFHQENPARAVFFLAKTSADPKIVAPSIRGRLQDLDADVLLERFGTLKDAFAFNRDSMDFEHSELGKHATVAPVFAGIALLLSALGLAAVIGHSVSQRTKEIGIRMAIGAATRDIARMVLAEGMRPVAAGVAIGLAVSMAANRLLEAQLVGVSPYDPATMAAAPLVLIVVSMAACQIPARRAAHVDPAIALRDQ